MRSGETLGGRFLLEKELEHDIPGVTRYRARDQRLQREVIVDVLATLSPAAIRREATRASRLRDPRLARIVATGREDADHGELSFVVYEQVPGVRLDRVMEAHLLSASLAVAIIGGAARGLAAARNAGIHHGYLRPSAMTITGRGRVVVDGVGVDGEAAWQARLAPLRSEEGDATALARIFVACLTGAPLEGAAVDQLPDDLGERARRLAVDTVEGRPPATLDQIIEALAPFDSRALMGFPHTVDSLPLTPARQLEAERRAHGEERRAATEQQARLAATRGILATSTLEAAVQGAEVEVAERWGPDVAAVRRASEQMRFEEQERRDAEEAARLAAEEEAKAQEEAALAAAVAAAAETEARHSASTESLPTVNPASVDNELADKYEAGFNTLEMMVSEQHAARTPGTWELVLTRMHEQWPRSAAITRSLERAKERANSGGPLNGTRITLLLALIGLGFAVWLAWGWFTAPLSSEIDIERSTPGASTPVSPSPSPTGADASSSPDGSS